ncbi:serine/threonine-protein kinase [Paramicrobacterium sp. CJ85]|uniref:serine/threonine-protein kinase n=1 Tax=Paramicrobacterium sp. CJ85 TaxID=3445355 RepID=UPI003F5E9D84
MGAAPQIEGYSYVKLLGRGGFSDVYLYHQQLPNRFVAIKVLRTEALSDALRRQFTAEANLMARVSTHPAIGTIYAAGVDADGQPYLVMEYCAGGSLGAQFRHAPLDVADVLHIGVRLASALETAHRSGVVHRDVKPANVLINDYGSAVLTDFGISAIADGFPEATRMREQAYGTQSTIDSNASDLGMSIPWAAPESFDEETLVDVRSDVYSLAATLFSLLEGRSPCEIPDGTNRAAHLIARVQSGQITPMQRTGVPPSVVEALMIGLNHDPSHRYPTALAFAERLNAVEHELGLPTTRIEVPRTPDAATTATTIGTFSTPLPQSLVPTVTPNQLSLQQQPPTKKRRVWLITSIAAGAVVVALALGLGIPWATQVIASNIAPTPTPTATEPLVIDELDLTKTDRGWDIFIPDDLAPPHKLESKVLAKGKSNTKISANSDVTFGYADTFWDYGWEVHMNPPDNVNYSDTVTVSGDELEEFIGIDMVGMPVGTSVLAAAPAGFFAENSPMGDATMRTQIVVIRIIALT